MAGKKFEVGDLVECIESIHTSMHYFHRGIIVEKRATTTHPVKDHFIVCKVVTTEGRTLWVYPEDLVKLERK
tara:strand:+ start:2714 stop:2929 length:216 start_codon:yes stop_codon:yes gene_type:complete